MMMEIDAAVAARARTGAALDQDDLHSLDAADVLSLGMLGDEVRRARVGDAVSYARVLEVGGAGLPDDERTSGALDAADEVRLTMLPSTLDQALAAVAHIHQLIGERRRLTGFSLADLVARGWGPLADVLAALKGAGLASLVEAPVDLVSPSEVATAVATGLGPATLSVRRWPADGRVPLLLRTREIVLANATVRRFAPLSREQSVAVPTTGYHDVRMVSLARIGLPMIPTIEVDWQQYGPKLAQVALMFGANHLDRVSPVDDPALGPRRAAVEEVRRNITAAGFNPSVRVS